MSLREALPEKQSLKRGVATWATVVVNNKAKGKKRKKRKDMIEGMGDERDQVALSHPGQREREKKKEYDNVPELVFYIYYVTN